MGASNQTNTGNKEFYKLKEDKTVGSPTQGQLFFYKQEKKDGKWADGSTFNQLAGVVTSVNVKEYEYQGEKKKQLEITLQDVADTMIFSLGLRSNTAQSILNTLSGDNGFDLKFACGQKKKGKDGKDYPTFYVNLPDGKQTNWKYRYADLPKVTTTTDEEGNKIKKGQKAADEFWMEVVKFVQDKLGSKEPRPTYTTEPALGKQKPVVKQEEETDLPF